MENVFWILDFRFWSGFRNPKSKIGNLKSGQASLEMTAALIGALLLLFGSLKVCLYFAERLVTRHQNYGTGRIVAASAVRPPPPFPEWGPLYPDDAANPLNKPMPKLNIFEGDD